jgi:hypothetical protein
MSAAPVKVGKKLAIGVFVDVVKIEIVCGSEYEAQVLYEDLTERMQSGEAITLSAAAAEGRVDGGTLPTS